MNYVVLDDIIDDFKENFPDDVDIFDTSENKKSQFYHKSKSQRPAPFKG